MSLLECHKCGEMKPLEKFYNLEKWQVCSDCMTGEDTSGNDHALKMKAKDIMGDLAALGHRDVEPELPKMRSIVAGIYEDFGGVRSFGSHFQWLIHELSLKRPLSPSVGQLMLQFMKLHLAVEQADELVSARSMTDDQLQKETELATVKMILDAASDPAKRQLLESILEKNGLKLEDANPKEVIASLSQDLAKELRDVN